MGDKQNSEVSTPSGHISLKYILISSYSATRRWIQMITTAVGYIKIMRTLFDKTVLLK